MERRKRVEKVYNGGEIERREGVPCRGDREGRRYTMDGRKRGEKEYYGGESRVGNLLFSFSCKLFVFLERKSKSANRSCRSFLMSDGSECLLFQRD